MKEMEALETFVSFSSAKSMFKKVNKPQELIEPFFKKSITIVMSKIRHGWFLNFYPVLHVQK